MKRPLTRLTFSIRFLMLITAFSAILISWWFAEYQISEPWGTFPTIQMRKTLRKTWNGSVIYADNVHLIEVKSGKTIATAEVCGLEESSIANWWIGDEGYEYWTLDGTGLKWNEWHQYIASSEEFHQDLEE